MLETPVLERRYRAFLMEGEGVALLSHTAEHLLPARLYDELVPLLRGTSTEDLVEHFRGRWEPVDVWCALWHLERRGCVVEGLNAGVGPPGPELGSVSGDGSFRMALAALGEIAADDWRAALLNHGFVLDEAARLTTVLTDSYLRSELAEINDRALRTGRPWLLAKPTGPVIWVGPIFRPGDGGCWKCLEARLRRNRPLEYHLVRGTCSARPLDAPDASAGDGNESASFARELSRLLQGLDTDAPTDSVTLIDTTDGSRSRHQVPRRPQCPACGSSGLYAQRTAVPFTLTSRPKRTSEGGACRVTDTMETLMRYCGLLDPLVGAVHHMERLGSRIEVPSHVYQAHYGCEPAPRVPTLATCMLSRSGGKGRNEVEAQTSTLGEAIERYSGWFQGDEPRLSASLEELGPAAVHPNTCMQFSETQFQGRQEWNRSCASWEWVPVPFEPTRRLEWTPVWPLSGGAPRYLPTMLLYGGYPADPDDACCLYDPSGTAAGNSPEEALLHGLLELVERDSLALWWYNRAPRPGVDLAGVTDSYCRGVISYHRSRGRDLWVLDLTSDLGIPAFVAVSRQPGPGSERIMLGSGAHLDPRLALVRAVAEMDQVLTCLTAWECDGTLDHTLRDWLRSATVEDQPYLAPGPFSPTRLQDVPHLAASDIANDICVCERILAKHGIEIMLLDQTRPDIGVSVMKVIAPGLRHFRRRLAPGRLYTAPVAAGWLRQPRPENELNPIGFFL